MTDGGSIKVPVEAALAGVNAKRHTLKNIRMSGMKLARLREGTRIPVNMEGKQYLITTDILLISSSRNPVTGCLLFGRGEARMTGQRHTVALAGFAA